jgi:hypothetical protein
VLINIAEHLDFSEAYEVKLLAALVREPSLIEGHRDALKPTLFVHPEKRQLASCILEHYDKYRVVPDFDTVEAFIHQLVKEQGNEGRERMYRLILAHMQSTSLGDKQKIIEDTLNHAVMMGVIQAVHRHVRQGMSTNEVDGLLEDIRKSQALAADRLRLGSLFFEDYDRLDWSRSHNVLTTGIDSLDEIIGGGLANGELGVLLGPYKTGKTWFVTNFGVAALKAGYDVVHVSTEMPEAQTLLRYDSVLHGKLPTKCNREEIIAAIKEWSAKLKSRLITKYFMPGTCQPATLKAYVRTLVAEKIIRPEERKFLLIVDYPAKMCNSNGDNHRFTIANNYNTCLQIAREFDVPCWVPMQANREAVKSRNTDGQHAAEALEPLRDADLILGIRSSDEERESGEVDLFVIASRYTEDRKAAKCMIDYEYGRITGL